MFCYQCEQTAKGTGCTTVGVCGKDAGVATLQDLLLVLAKEAGRYAHLAGRLGARDEALDHALIEALFTTVTNVNFDAPRLILRIAQTAIWRDKALELARAAYAAKGEALPALPGLVPFAPAATLEGLLAQGAERSILAAKERLGEDVTGVLELITYGLKGAAAYADHAYVLGHAEATLFAGFNEALAFLTEPHTLEECLGMALKVGALNYKVMELLDGANTGTYGHPVPTTVPVTAKRGKAILVSGHDLKDLEELLKQTAGRGINIYTHGEMLPAHGYPQLKKFPHLVGNYGGAWQDQRKEFDAFPGAILMTTNCIQRPAESYLGRIFTSGLVAFPNVVHVPERDFAPVIDAALAAPGFTEDEPEKTILVGFGHNAVLGVADKVVAAVKAGKIRHFFLVGGCDGAKSGRNYYTDFASKAPKDTIILTLACGKYRFNKLEFGDIEGIPRLLDVGQCNDAYSAIQIALALAAAFETDVNGLPLSLVLSWYEQKAVAILLTLLHLGIKNVRLGPSLPAFVSPAVLKVLVESFGLTPITTAQADLDTILN